MGFSSGMGMEKGPGEGIEIPLRFAGADFGF